MTKAKLREVQEKLNHFTESHHLEVAKLIVDGKLGPATKKRIRMVKFWLGFDKENRGIRITDEFLWMLNHPNIRAGNRGATKVRIDRAERGAKLRAERRRHVKENRDKADKTEGVGTFDGRPCANWLIPYLEWARQHGWRGGLNSGWRDPVHSERLCRAMCGAPSCPGRCAGRASNHVGHVKPSGAVDVSDYTNFATLMKRCPHSPSIFNALGAQDPVHFSASGR